MNTLTNPNVAHESWASQVSGLEVNIEVSSKFVKCLPIGILKKVLLSHISSFVLECVHVFHVMWDPRVTTLCKLSYFMSNILHLMDCLEMCN